MTLSSLKHSKGHHAPFCTEHLPPGHCSARSSPSCPRGAAQGQAPALSSAPASPDSSLAPASSSETGSRLYLSLHQASGKYSSDRPRARGTWAEPQYLFPLVLCQGAGAAGNAFHTKPNACLAKQQGWTRARPWMGLCWFVPAGKSRPLGAQGCPALWQEDGDRARVALTPRCGNRQPAWSCKA